ncbi:hypothetical protein G4G93_03060 [Methylobacterium sp. DB0501]|uniref:Spy/CpxP family protein refolding chaperone n=2 Tax=Methylobacterium TaxID=407 RepID=UPI0013EDC12C|nr:Spy/CpxP family protein refolding chaperone [Methylobacterium sp. DB0501]NGM32922.1 hypothetical protein [Methylobacterium sp. DB0501]
MIGAGAAIAVVGFLAGPWAGSSAVRAGDVTTTGAIGESATVSQATVSQANFKVLTDARIGVVKAVLQLTPEQQRYWPPVEEAIRARAEGRYHRLSALVGHLQQRGEVDPIAAMRTRADSLGQRSAELKRLGDAWQPLYQTLGPDQKERMRLVTARIIGGLREAIETRRRELVEDEDDEG